MPGSTGGAGSGFQLPTLPQLGGGVMRKPPSAVRGGGPSVPRPVQQPAPPPQSGGNTISWGGGTLGDSANSPYTGPAIQARQQAAAYTPSGQGMWGPTGGATGGWSTPGTTGGAGAYRPPAAPQRAPGLLTTPGQNEQFWDRHKADFDSPMAGERTMSEAGDIFRKQSNLQSLYESGNQGLNTWYDRERDKRQKRLEDQMSAAGVFGSGATARGMFELEAELGAQQARDMADLAGRADQEVTSRGNSLLNAGQGLQSGELSRLGMGGTLSGGAQDRFEQRERYGINDQMRMGQNLSGIFGQMSGASADEQARLQGDVIQSLINEQGMDATQAENLVRELFQGLGTGLKGYEISRMPTPKTG